MNSKSGFSKTQATSAAVLALALFCARTYIPEISEKLRTSKIEPQSDPPLPEFPTKGLERLSPQGSCTDASYALEVTSLGGIAANGGAMLSSKNCLETTSLPQGTHNKHSGNELARELLEKHRARGHVTNDQPIPHKGQKTPSYVEEDKPSKNLDDHAELMTLATRGKKYCTSALYEDADVDAIR
jgi:hypothetical protein